MKFVHNMIHILTIINLYLREKLYISSFSYFIAVLQSIARVANIFITTDSLESTDYSDGSPIFFHNLCW